MMSSNNSCQSVTEAYYYEDKWMKGVYKCNKDTPKCAIYPWETRKAGRRKCIPCGHLTFTRHDGVIERFDSSPPMVASKSSAEKPK